MQIDKKKLIALTLIIVSLIFCLAVLMISKKNNIKADYYYNFTYDDNKISQSVKIYNKEKKLQTIDSKHGKRAIEWQLFYLHNLDVFIKDYLMLKIKYFQKLLITAAME